MRVLIIGGTSFIGPYVVKLLHGMGHQVAVFHRGQTNRELPRTVQHILGDRKNMADYREDFDRFSPDVVLDMIPSFEEEAHAVLNICKGIAHRVVAISSQDVYRAYGMVRGLEAGNLEPLPITEKSRLRQKLYPYQDDTKDKQDWCNKYDKIKVEEVIMQSPDWIGTVLRLPAVYGPYDNQHRFFSYLNLKRIIDQRPYILMDDSFAPWRWTHAYVENVAAAIALAIVDSRSAGRIYNVGAPDTPQMYDWVQEIGRRLGWKGEIVRVSKERLPEHLRFPLDATQQLVTDSSLIREELGYREKVSWEEGLD